MDGTLGFKWKGRGAELGVYLTQEVCVVGHHFQFDDLGLQSGCRLVDELFQARVHTVHEHGAAVLGTPDDMVLAGVGDVSVGLEWNTCSHTGIMPQRGV